MGMVQGVTWPPAIRFTLIAFQPIECALKMGAISTRKAILFEDVGDEARGISVALAFQDRVFGIDTEVC